MDQGVSRGRVGGLEPHGQGPQASLRGPAKCFAALEEVLVEVEADIRLQAFRETLQDLKHGSKQTRSRSDEVRHQRFLMCA